MDYEQKETAPVEMPGHLVVAYEWTPEKLASEVDKLRGQSFSTPALYREGVKAIATCRTLRVNIEKRRKELKADALEYGRKVDSVAKALTSIVENVEEPLLAEKQAVDDAKAKAKREAAEAEQKRIADEARAKLAAEEEAARVQREAEEKRIAEQRAELERFRAELLAEKQAEAKARAEKEEAERRERLRLEAELRKEREELDRRQRLVDEAEQKYRAEERARELAEQRKREEEEAEIHRQEHARALEQRRMAIAPDKVKLNVFLVCIKDLERRTPEWRCTDSRLELARVDAVRWLNDAKIHLQEAINAD